MLKKVNYILDRKQKVKLFFLMVIIIVGAFIELLGVSAILPLINVVLEPEIVDTKWYLAFIKKTMNYTQTSEIVIFLAVFLIMVYIIKNIYITFMNDMQYRFIFNNQRKLAIKMMDTYLHQRYLYHVSKNVAELQRNVKDDVNGFYTIILNCLQLFAETSVCIAIIIFLMRTDIMTTMIVAMIILLFSLLVGIISKKILVKKGIENRKYNIQLNKWLIQSFSGIKEIKVMNKEKYFIDKYSETFCKYTTLQRQQSMLKFLPKPIMESVCISGLLLTLIIKLLINIGDVQSFIPALSVFAVAAFRMLPSFNRISGYIGAIMFDRPSVDVLYNDLKEIELLRQQANVYGDNAIKLEVENKKIILKQISFHYPEHEKWVLDNVSLEIEANTSVAFIGASGAGKTTLADIILGILEPQEGAVLIGEKDIRQNIDEWHSHIGYIPQVIYLIDDTIRANIAFGIDEECVDEVALKNAIKEAQLESFIAGLEEGENTIVGDRGVKLSGGQRQRIGIARALYSNPDILVLDEATSALDNETEKEVMEAIDSLHGTRTLIVIAHRLSTIKHCDYIYEIADGKAERKNKEDVLC